MLRRHRALGVDFLSLYAADIPRSDHTPAELRQLARWDSCERRRERVLALACTLAGEPPDVPALALAHGWQVSSAKRQLRAWRVDYHARGLRAILGPWLRDVPGAELERWQKRWNR